MSNLLEHAKRELDLVGMTADNDEELNRMMREHILTMVEVFSNEGHSGFSANYAINILSKLLKFEPISPLTGEDSEWTALDYGDDMKWQNNRLSRVFKGADGRAYDIEGTVFYEWVERELEPDEEGYPGIKRYKSHYTGRDSRTYITFPYTPTTQIVERKSDAE